MKVIQETTHNRVENETNPALSKVERVREKTEQEVDSVRKSSRVETFKKLAPKLAIAGIIVFVVGTTIYLVKNEGARKKIIDTTSKILGRAPKTTAVQPNIQAVEAVVHEVVAELPAKIQSAPEAAKEIVQPETIYSKLKNVGFNDEFVGDVRNRIDSKIITPNSIPVMAENFSEDVRQKLMKAQASLREWGKAGRVAVTDPILRDRIGDDDMQKEVLEIIRETTDSIPKDQKQAAIKHLWTVYNGEAMSNEAFKSWVQQAVKKWN